MTDNKIKKISKGFEMEEKLKTYFYTLGYYVIRGIDIKYNNSLVTDIDLWLYNKSSAFSVERINVDIKNKKRSQAIERIFWAKGVQNIFGFDKCIIATKDTRPDISEFGKKNNVIVLDGNFLAKISDKESFDEITKNRLSEEEFLALFDLNGMSKFMGDWRSKIQNSKSRLIEKSNFTTVSETLLDIKFFIEQTFLSTQNKETELRGVYFSISTLLIQLDFLSKDLTFEQENQKLVKIKSGIKYGENNLSFIKDIMKIIKSPLEDEFNINGDVITNWLDSELESDSVNMLSEFLASTSTSNKLFITGKYYLELSFNRSICSPKDIPSEYKSFLFILLDYFGFERKKYINLFN